MTLTPVLLNRILMGLIVFSIGIIGASFYFGSTFLREQAIRTDHAKIDGELVSEEITRLQSLRTYFENNQDTVRRAADVVAESQQYSYQNQVIDDINTYAGRNGITILSFDFPVAAPNAPTTTPAPAGLKRSAITINVQGPVPYDRFMLFVKSIEQNLTKMQITSISLAPDPDNRSLLTDSSINIEVYLR